MKKLEKYIGYILFIAALIGWAMTYGKQMGRLDRIEESQVKTEESIEDMKGRLIKQETLNEFIIKYIEINEKS